MCCGKTPHRFWLLTEFHSVTNPERSLSTALLVLPQRTSWDSPNLAKLRELGIRIAQSAAREGNDIVELFWRFIGQTFFFLSMDFFYIQ